MKRLRAFAGIAVAVWTFFATAVGTAMVMLTPSDRIPSGFRAEDVVKYLSMPASLSIVGFLVAWRRPRNPIGWAFALAGAVIALQFLAGGYAVRALFAPTPLQGGSVAAWIFNWSGSLIGLMLITLLFAFPDGMVPLRRARVGAALGFVASLLPTGFLAFSAGPLRNFPSVENPFGLASVEGAYVPVLALTAVLGVLALLLAIGTHWRRVRRSSDVQRQQFKWFMGGVVMCCLLTALGIASPEPAISNVLISIGIAAPPVCIGVAILRYRLYDIDVVIKRTLVYGATSAVIAGTFFIGIVALQTMFRELTAGSEAAVAISTLASFALFQPIRRRVQDAVNQRFDRSRYDAAQTLDLFVERCRDDVDLDTLQTDLLGVISQTMAPTHASLWLRQQAIWKGKSVNH